MRKKGVVSSLRSRNLLELYPRKRRGVQRQSDPHRIRLLGSIQQKAARNQYLKTLGKIGRGLAMREC